LEIVIGLLSFGQDLFGNQFCFDTNARSVILLDMESGKREKIANNFGALIEILFGQFDYFVWPKILKAWLTESSLMSVCQLRAQCPRQAICLKKNISSPGEEISRKRMRLNDKASHGLCCLIERGCHRGSASPPVL
jgi:hypothetical protein